MPLRVFETRYLDMVSRCLREDIGFVVVMLKEDSSPDFDHPFYDKGTLAKIVDFDQGSDGLLNIVVEGQEQVLIQHADQMLDGLWVADIKPISLDDAHAVVPVPEEFEELAAVLKALVQHPAVDGLKLNIDYGDSQQVGWRLTELLPLENAQKQYLFELDDPIYRLEKISDQLTQLAG